ncbi:MAG: amidohydrolase family protein [Pseudomonadota bacterium]
MLRTIFFGALFAAAILIAALMVFLPVSDPAGEAGGASARAQSGTQDPAGENTTASQPADVSTNSFVLTNARILTQTASGLSFSDPQNVRIENGVIAALGQNLTADLPRVDAGGHFMIPGLIDAHTHSYGSAFTDAARFGVTTHLDMFTNALMLPATRASRAERHNRPEADMFSAGTMGTSPGGHGTQFGFDIPTLTEPAQAQGWVNARLAEGSDYIKLAYIPGSSRISSIDRATAKAVIDAAHDRGVLVVAHIDTLEAATHMVEDGIDGLVHVFRDVPATPKFIQLAVEKGVFVIPTLVVIASVDGHKPGASLQDDATIAPYLTPVQRGQLTQQFSNRPPGPILKIAQANTKALFDAGVPIYAGADAPNPSTTYGASLHQELSLLVEAGLPAAAVLRAATMGPADAFSLTGRGAIAPGAIADFILLDANPLLDITATRAMASVYKNGYPVKRALDDAQSDRWTVSDLGQFDTDLSVDGSSGWTSTTDSMAGGKSVATVSHMVVEKEGADEGVMAVKAQVKPGFPFPWAGAVLPFTDDFTAGRDISGFTTLTFDVRGTPGVYRAMLFGAGPGGVPPTKEFAVTEEWASVTIPLADVPGVQLESTTGLALVTGTQVGVYEFVVDNVRFER